MHTHTHTHTHTNKHTHTYIWIGIKFGQRFLCMVILSNIASYI